MISDGDYATPAIVCKARGGMCFLNGKCRSCEFARKYEVNKLFYSYIEKCPYRTSAGICNWSFEECKGADCQRMMKAAEQRIINDRASE